MNTESAANLAATTETETHMGKMKDLHATRGALSLVPAHINDVTGYFCDGGEVMEYGGRCSRGCAHAAHYSNDGHPECEDDSHMGDNLRRAR